MAPIDARKKLEQLRRNKNKSGNNKKSPGIKPRSSAGKVQDLRQLIARKNKSKKSPNKVQTGRIAKTRSTSNAGPRDLRDTNRKLAARKSSQQTPSNRKDAGQLRRNDRSGPNIRSVASSINNNVNNNRRTANINNAPTRPFRTVKKVQQQYYVPPHLQQPHPATYIIAPAATPQSKLAMDSVPEFQPTGASVLVSNLMPSITQSEIIELFGDVGVMNAVNMINPTTALVTYQKGSDAVEAVKVYHNRLLDGKPMFVYMMPNASTSNIRSRIQ